MARKVSEFVPDESDVNRRSVLRGMGGALTVGSLSGLFSQSSAAQITRGGGGGSGPHYNTVQSSTELEGWDHKTLLTTTIKYSDPYYHRSCNCVGVDIQVNSDAATFFIGNPEHLRNLIDWNTIEITYPDNEVHAGESNNWIGGMANYDDPEESDTQERAVAIIDITLQETPYIGTILGAIQTAKRLDRLVTPDEAPDSRKWSWNFSNAGRVNTWVRFVAEASKDENYEIDIHNEVGGFADAETDFTLYL